MISLLIIKLENIASFIDIVSGIYLYITILYCISITFKKSKNNFSNNNQLNPNEIIELCDNYHSKYNDSYENDELSEVSESEIIVNNSFKNNKKNNFNDKYTVSRILSHQGYGKNLKFYVNWEGYSHNDNTYEPLDNLKNCTILHNYVKKNKDLHYLKEKLGI